MPTIQNIRQYWKDWRERADLLVLLSVLVVVVGSWAFLEIADEVTEGDLHHFDHVILRSLRTPDDLHTPIGPSWLKEVMRDLTALGGFAQVLLIIVIVSLYLLLARKYHALILVLAATLGGFALSTLLKDFYARPRPDFVPHLTEVSSASFPSGHSMLSAVVYLTLGALLARLVKTRALKLYFLGVALLLTFLVGITRIYLGVHYPTDVLAGWTAGLVWAVGCWLVARFLQHQGAVEQSMTSPAEAAAENNSP